jgi:8-oxo-dGTP diphosphatase
MSTLYVYVLCYDYVMKERLKAWGDTKIISIVSAFVFNESKELLLLQRHSADLGGGQWGTPGGRIEAGESPELAMGREYQEETGIKGIHFTELGSHEIRMPHGTVHMTSYSSQIPKKTPIILDPDEHVAFAWFSVKGLVDVDNILWGIPSVLRDFGLLEALDEDPSLADGSSVKLLGLAK